MSKSYLNEKELSAMTGRAIQTLRNDRFKGRGFPYIKLGKSVRYDEEVVIDIMEKSKVETSSFRTESQLKKETVLKATVLNHGPGKNQSRSTKKKLIIGGQHV